MASQIFPNLEELMYLLLQELPENVYPSDFGNSTDLNKRSYSSSELRAHASLMADLYENLSKINSDKFLTLLTQEGVGSWERQLFATAQDSTLDLETRRARLISKLRSSGGLSYIALKNIIAGILTPKGLDFELASWSGPHNGAWVLEDSELEMGTYLTSTDPIWGARADFPHLDCDLNADASDLTDTSLTEIQESAYRYELRIFGEVDSLTLSVLDSLLTHFEPARSDHLILKNHTGNEIVPIPTELLEWKLEDSSLGDDTYLVAK